MDSLSREENRSIQLVNEAEQKGMEISEEKFKLRDIHMSRMQARTMVHAFDPKREEEVVGKGLSAASIVQADAGAAIHEYYFRRIGLGVVTAIITLVVVCLYLLIRRIERRQQKG